jgi:hypothetical protein
MCTHACGAVFASLVLTDANMKLIAQRGGGELLVRTMEANMTATGIQEHCTWALQHLSLRGACAQPTARTGAALSRQRGGICGADDLREPLAKAGAIKRIIDALKGFPGEKRVQQGGTWALSCFSASGTCDCTRSCAPLCLCLGARPSLSVSLCRLVVTGEPVALPAAA